MTLARITILLAALNAWLRWDYATASVIALCGLAIIEAIEAACEKARRK
jgi:hypothetical protein